jgi:hypothetical protein
LASVCPILAVLVINKALEFFFPKPPLADPQIFDMSHVTTSSDLIVYNQHDDISHETELLPIGGHKEGSGIGNYGSMH